MPRVALAAVRAHHEEHGHTHSAASGGGTRRQQKKSHQQQHEDAPQHPSLSRNYSRAAFELAEELPATEKLNSGHFDKLNQEDIDELFSLLDVNGNGTLEFHELAAFFKEVMSPPCTDQEIKLIDIAIQKEPNGTISSDALYLALTSSLVKHHMEQLQAQAHLRKSVMFEDEAPISRDLFVERTEFFVNRDDAFRTLPLSLISITLLILLVLGHLSVWKRQQLERGLEDWVEGYGDQFIGPYLEDHISNHAQMWDWLHRSGLPAVLGNCGTNRDNLPACKVGTRNWLVGDLQLRRLPAGEDTTQTSWLLHSDAALAFLEADPDNFLGAAREQARVLMLGDYADWSEGPWVETDDFILSFTVYNERVRMFAENDVHLQFDDFGRVAPVCITNAIVIEAYTDIQTYVTDALYLVSFLVPFFNEGKELLTTIRLAGCWSGLQAYMGFWNMVDWVNIITSIASVVVWLLVMFSMRATSFNELLVDREGRWDLVSDVFMLSKEELVQANADLRHVSTLFNVMHMTMLASSVAIMFKFFKAFQANPRLQVVTKTLVKASPDIFHFGVVFSTIFIAYAIAGHVLFGSSLIDFNSFTKSLDSLFCCLMGEFDWYTDRSESDHPMNSHVPQWVLGVYFYSFMVFVLLILLNMLLAIILGHYDELVQDLHNAPESDAMPLWTQVDDFFVRMRETWKFISMSDLLIQLNDDDPPTHTEPWVTAASLVDAFPGMTTPQAVFIVECIQPEAQRRLSDEGDCDDIKRMKNLQHFIEIVAKEIHIVAMNLKICQEKVAGVGKAGVHAVPKWMSGEQSPSKGAQRGHVPPSPRSFSQHSGNPGMARSAPGGLDDWQGQGGYHDGGPCGGGWREQDQPGFTRHPPDTDTHSFSTNGGSRSRERPQALQMFDGPNPMGFVPATPAGAVGPDRGFPTGAGSGVIPTDVSLQLQEQLEAHARDKGNLARVAYELLDALRESRGAEFAPRSARNRGSSAPPAFPGLSLCSPAHGESWQAAGDIGREDDWSTYPP